MRRASILPIAVAAVVLCFLGLGGCSSRGESPDAAVPDSGPATDSGPPPVDMTHMFPDTGIGTGTLGLTRAVPNHGPFRGGNVVVLRGSGLSLDDTVTFAGHMVQPADMTLIDSYRLQVIAPAGMVGPADVVVTDSTGTATLPGGYTYDGLYVEPDRGSTSGGTFITITGDGTSWATGDTVTLGHSACSGVMVVSPNRITCRTPPLAAGTVDVTVTHVADGTTVTGVGAYTYFDTSDPFSGGLGGGPVTGTVNVTVIDAMTGMPVDGAVVILGDGSGPYGGLTDTAGQITFSGPDLMGAQTVTVAKHCYEKTTFVDADAQDVTVFLVPWQDPMCGMGGMPPPGRTRSGSFVSGQLVWLGPHEFQRNPWSNVPPPRGDEVKVAYVYATQANLSYANPDPAAMGAGTIQRVLEVPSSPLPATGRGYPYRIFVAPGSFAVYALAGLESASTAVFTPYDMGIARNVLVGPGDEAFNVDMTMDIPLDHNVTVAMTGLPMRARTGPNRFKVRALIDLGGEGFIVRQVGPLGNTHDYDTLRRATNDRPFVLVQQPALFDALADGRYRIDAGWYTGDYDGFPFTNITRKGVSDVNVTITMDGYLGVPQATAPAYGDAIPADRILRWTADGADPSFHEILMSGGDYNPAWRIFTPGNVREASIPDMSRTTPATDDISPGTVTWEIYAITVPSLDYNTFSYQYLNNDFWTKSAADLFSSSLGM